MILDSLGMMDEEWMRLALGLAEKAQELDEVPVGAIIVKNGEIIGQGYNQPIKTNDPSGHAEMIAIRAAGQQIQNYRLEECTLYVTLEPCAMCIGAIFHARLRRLVFAASDPKTGVCGSILDLPAEKRLNHHLEVHKGLLAEESARLLRQFFYGKRHLDKLARYENSN